MRLPLVALTCLAVLAGCGGGEGREVKDVLTQFVGAYEDGDADAYCALLTPETLRLVGIAAEGRYGAEGDCVRWAEENGIAGSDTSAPSDQAIRGVKAADVDIEGDVARVKGPDEDERLPLRRIDGDWRIDLANSPLHEYGLRGTATCTQQTLDLAEQPLPAPTREGIAKAADRRAANVAALLRTLERAGAPAGKDAEHREVARELRRWVAAWRRSARAMRGFRSPLEAFNAAMATEAKGIRRVNDEVSDLGVGCLGDLATLEEASDVAEQAGRACARARRQVGRVRSNAAIGRIGREVAAQLRRLEPPRRYRRLYGATIAAFARVYGSIGAATRPKQVERLELLALRASIGFVRIGLPRCAEL